MPSNNGMEVIGIVDPDGGGGSGLAGLAIAGTLVVGAVAIIGMLLLKAQERAAMAKAEQEWARAAALQARADMIDARTAQIGMVGEAILPMLFAVFGALCFAAIVIGALYFLDRRARERQELFLLQQQMQASQLYMPVIGWRGVGDGVLDGVRQGNVAEDDRGQPDLQTVGLGTMPVRSNAGQYSRR